MTYRHERLKLLLGANQPRSIRFRIVEHTVLVPMSATGEITHYYKLTKTIEWHHIPENIPIKEIDAFAEERISYFLQNEEKRRIEIAQENPQIDFHPLIGIMVMYYAEQLVR